MRAGRIFGLTRQSRGGMPLFRIAVVLVCLSHPGSSDLHHS